MREVTVVASWIERIACEIADRLWIKNSRRVAPGALLIALLWRKSDLCPTWPIWRPA